MHGINSGSLFSTAHCVKSFHIGNTMDTFTIILNCLVIAVVFLITCPDEGKGYFTVDWTDLNEKVPESAIKRLNKLWKTANKRQTMNDETKDPDDDDSGIRVPDSERIIVNTAKVADQNPHDSSNQDDNNKTTKKSDSYDELSVIPLNMSPVTKRADRHPIPMTFYVTGCYPGFPHLCVGRTSPLTVNQSAKNHEKSANVKRSVNDPSALIILPSRL